MARVDPLLSYLKRPSRRRLARVVRVHHEYVWRIALRSCGHRDDSLDVTQDVFLRLLLDPPPADSVTSPRAWLAFRVVSRTGHLYRAASRRRRREEEHARRLAADGLGTGDHEALEDSIARLPEELRVPLELKYRAGLSTSQIAESLDVSERTARRRLEEARARLRASGLPQAFSGLAALSSMSSGTEAPAELLTGLLRLVEQGGALAGIGAGAGGAGALSTSAATKSVATSVASTVGSVGTTGGLVMAAKKMVFVAAGIALASLIGGAVIWQLDSRDGVRQTEEVAAQRESRGIDPSSLGDGGFGRSGEAQRGGSDQSTPEKASAGEPLRGRVVDILGERIAGVTVRAVETAKWMDLFTDSEAKRLDRSRQTSDLLPVRERLEAFVEKCPVATTDADGQFLFRGLPAVELRLIALHDGFQPEGETVVTAGALKNDKHVVVLRPSLGISGHVVDAIGTPLRDAEVSARNIDRGRGSGARSISDMYAAWRAGSYLTERLRVRTDTGGRFALGSLSGARYDLTATAAGFTSAQALHVEVGADAVRMVLQPASEVRGRIVDEAGDAVANATVTIAVLPLRTIDQHFAYKANVEDAELLPPHEASTDEAGHFSVSGLAQGPHTLIVRHEAYAWHRSEVEVRAESTDLGDFELLEALGLRGRVVGPDGRGVAAALVSAHRPALEVLPTNRLATPPRESWHEVRTDAEGRFLIAQLADEPIDLQVRAQGLQDVFLEGVQPAATELVVRLEAGASLFALVLDGDTDTPVADARVEYGFGDRRETRTDAKGSFAMHGIDLAALHRSKAPLRVRHPDFGRAKESVSPLGTSASSPHLVRLRPEEQIPGTVHDGEGEPIEGARVSIELVGLAPETMGYNPAKGLVARSDAEGEFTIPSPDVRSFIDIPSVHLVVRAPGYAPLRTDAVAIPPIGQAWPHVAVELGRGGRIVGVIRSTEGLPIAGARVQWSFASGSNEAFASVRRASETVLSTTSDAEGRYVLGGLPSGSCDLRVSARGHAGVARVGVDVRGQETLENFELDAGRSLAGRVVDERGQPVARVEVVALPSAYVEQLTESIEAEFYRRMAILDQVGLAGTLTDEEGRYRLDHLPRAEVTLIARLRGFEAALSTAIADGEQPDDLQLLRFSVVEGRVADAETGRAVRSFVIDVIDIGERKRLEAAGQLFHPNAGTQGALRIRDQTGRFFYDGLRPSQYEIVVEAIGYLAETVEVDLEADSQETLLVELKSGETVEGLVVNGETGAPISGVSIGVWPQGDGRKRPRMSQLKQKIFTAEDGSFRITGLGAGEVALRATHRFCVLGREESFREIKLPEDAGKPLRFEMVPGGVVEGELLGVDKEPKSEGSWSYRLRFAELDSKTGELLEEKDATPQLRGGEVHPDPDGRFYKESARPGKYRLYLTRQLTRRGKSESLGPMGGFVAMEDIGDPETFDLGEFEIRPGEVTRLEKRVPPAAGE